MIVFDLHCERGHRFEGWFSSSADYEAQQMQGLVSCPECGSENVDKAPSAPAVPAKANSRPERRPESGDTARALTNSPMPPEVQAAMRALAKAQAKALKDSTWVGDKFAEASRAMHYGERDEAPIHGEASAEEAQALLEEGVPIAPLPFPVAPPDKLN